MSSHNATVADAVVAALNAGTFPIEFEAVRRYVVRMDATDLTPGITYVHVVPKADAVEQFTRGGKSHDLQVDIGIRHKLTSFTGGEIENAEVDPLLAFAEAVAAFFQPGPLGTTGANFVSVDHSGLFSPQHLDEHGLFTSVITVTYKLTP